LGFIDSQTQLIFSGFCSTLAGKARKGRGAGKAVAFTVLRVNGGRKSIGFLKTPLISVLGGHYLFFNVVC
jgi:hypothetical protein